MSDTATAEGPAPAQPAPKAASPADQINAALALLNHPSNLAVPDRLHALETGFRVMAAQLIPLLPTE